ncbi:hypothetical protein AB0F52_44195 [Amycolatopsis sp. NPDC024027]|uniref:hypothetical protein n=1 Tax=Amycolatopsis sp. NPDC024027 TaxID=3154327 RepID=UPI0033E3A98E
MQNLLDYYESAQKLSYMHPELVDTLDERVRPGRHQLAAPGRRHAGGADRSSGFPARRAAGERHELDHVAQYNDLDAGYQQPHVTAMVMKRAYAIVGSNPRAADAKYRW